MKVLLVGNCILERLSDLLIERGYDLHFTYIANPVTLLSTNGVPDGLEEALTEFNIRDRLEKRTLKSQFEGISPGAEYDVVFVNYYHELRPLLRHKKENYFFHLNFEAIKTHESSAAAAWMTRNFDVADTVPEKYLERFTGLLLGIRNNFPQASIVIVNKFSPIKALGPEPFWYSTEGQPFDASYLNSMEEWMNAFQQRDDKVVLFHTENILIDFLKSNGTSIQFLFPEICSPSSNCTSDNYMRDLEHPSELFYESLANYVESIIGCHKAGDKESLRRICAVKDPQLWEAYRNKEFVLNPMPKTELERLFLDGHDTNQKVALENTIPHAADELGRVDEIFTDNLKTSQRFIELKNNFRTAFRIRPRESLLPALNMFFEYFWDLNESKNGKQYYAVNVHDFQLMLDSCRQGLPANF